MTRNDCPTPSCSRTKPRDKAFCLPCWRTIPLSVQESVDASYRAWQAGEPGHLGFLVRLGERIAAGAGDWPTP